MLRQVRLERAIGVIYVPEAERLSHYFDASLSEQFDAYFISMRRPRFARLNCGPVMSVASPTCLKPIPMVSESCRTSSPGDGQTSPPR